MKKILFSRESECIQPLRSLIEKQNHRTLVLWALDCTPRFLDIFEAAYPNDSRPRDLIPIAEAWAAGDIKMPEAKKAIHAAHHAAADAEGHPAAQAAARAIGHAAATIHVETHALGLIFYGLTALIYAAGANPKDCDEMTASELKWFYDRLLFWEINSDKQNRKWAAFLMKDAASNKEALLRKKTEEKAKS
ncbi:MAG: hypothetical protein LBE57_00545 [Methanosarcinales archaeon]|nr:hypothetical protein [Methanosarcinales archaeon]